MSEPRMPRGAAYVRIRNAGFGVRFDFKEKDVPFAEEVMKLAFEKYDAMLASERDINVTSPEQPK